MQSRIAEQNSEEIRSRILDAARDRFRDYGYGKTTMAEIAEDVQMSAANLYRYFENKHDIAAACASQCMGERVEVLREQARQPGQTAEQRLRAFVLGTLQYTQEAVQNQPKINELVATVASQRQDIVHAKINEQCALLAEILAYGNETGEFAIDDVITTARAVYATLTLFEVPIFVPLYSQKEFEAIAQQVVELLLKGLARR